MEEPFLTKGNEIKGYKSMRIIVIGLLLFGIYAIISTLFEYKNVGNLIGGLIVAIFCLIGAYVFGNAANKEMTEFLDFEKAIGLKNLKW